MENNYNGQGNPQPNQMPNQNQPYQQQGQQQNQSQGQYQGQYQMPNQPYQQPPYGPMQPEGHGLAVGSLVCGIIGLACLLLNTFAFIGSIVAIVGLVLASKAKSKGNNEGIRSAGFVLSLIAVIIDSLFFLACRACVAILASFGSSSHYGLILPYLHI